MTIRRYPRTLTGTDAAFPHTADYASSVTRYRNGDTAVTWACFLALAFLVGLLIVEAL